MYMTPWEIQDKVFEIHTHTHILKYQLNQDARLRHKSWFGSHGRYPILHWDECISHVQHSKQSIGGWTSLCIKEVQS